MESIGKILKTARLRKGLTIEELQQVTKIQKKHLLLIEKDDFSGLPSTYYARTFIKQYAAEVGVDGTSLINRFDGKVTPPVVEKQESVSSLRSANRNEDLGKSKRGSVTDNLPLAILFLVSLMIILIIGFLTLKDPGSKAIIKEPEVAETTLKETTEQPETNDTETLESEEEKPEENTEKLTISYLGKSGYDSNFEIKNVENDIDLELEAINETCWVGIQVDGEYVHDEMLEAGKKIDYTYENKPKKVGVVVGNVSNLKMRMNGQEVKYNPENESAIKKNVNFNITYQ